MLTDDTKRIIFRSAIRTARDTVDINRRSAPPVGESNPIEVVKSPSRGSAHGEKSTDDDGTTRDFRTPIPPRNTFDPDKLIGQTYLMDPQENGERFRAKVVQKIVEMEKGRKARLRDKGKVKFLVSIEGSEQPDQIVDYNVIQDYINAQRNDDDGIEVIYHEKSIVGHQGPLNSNHPDYKGSTYNVMVAWGDG